MNITCERAKRASMDFPGKINLLEFDTTNKEVVNEWGITDALYIDNKELGIGPPLSYKKIRKRIERSVKRVKNQVV